MVSLIFDALKLFFLDFKIDFLWIFILKIFQTVVSVYILFNLMNVRYVDPTIRFLLIPPQGYSN